MRQAVAAGLLQPTSLPFIVAGIVVGPSVLGWVEADQAVQVLAVLGLAFLLFVAGLEVELDRLRSVLFFPAAALSILERAPEATAAPSRP